MFNQPSNTSNALNDPDSFVKVEDTGTNPITSATENASFFDVKEEDGVEVEEVNDGDILDTGEDDDYDDDEDEEDDELYDEDEDDEDEEESEYTGP